jgi:DtxR family transcriptional regulator, Mn-dependent transcriptional regulator
MHPLSLHQQNYIETIYELCMEHEHAHTKAIADKLNIKMASVTEAMLSLAAQGLIIYHPRQPVTLTEAGIKVADKLHKRHQILANFFALIGCDLDSAEKTACRVEHNIDDDVTRLIEKLNKKLNHGL